MPNIALSALQQRDRLSGTGRYIQELFRQLPTVSKAHEFRLYCKHNQSHLFEEKKNAKLRVLEKCPFSPMKRTLWEFVHFNSILENDKIDLYHGPANFLPPRKNCPQILTLHDMVYFHNPKRTFYLRAKYWQIYIRQTWKKADHIITVSEFSKSEIMKYLPVPAEKISVVYNGVHPRFFEAIDKNTVKETLEKHQLKNPYIFYLGRLDPDKNVKRLIHAYGNLISEGFSQYDLVIGGIKEYQTSDLPALLKKYNITDRVQFLDFVDDQELPVLYQQASAFCFPSLNEGFGLPVAEAMAAGTPTVTSNISSLTEIAADGALQVDPFSVKSIAEGIRKVCGTPLGQEIAEKGKKRALKFNWTDTAKQTLAIYENVLNR